MKFSLNKGVIWLKILYTLYGFGICIIIPYFTLQMASLGLDEVDISYITGIIPIIVTITTPLIGLLSDAIGYKSVLIVDIILICLSTTSYIFVPVSHNKDQQSQTFWIVFGLQTFITIACNVGWTMWDTISVTEAVRHNSSYPAILLWALAGQAIAPFVSAWTIQDGENGVNDYSWAYFTNDGVMFLIVILLLWKLKISKEDKQEPKEKVSLKDALKQMLSVPMLTSLIGIGTTGLLYGVQTTYLYLYLQRNLKASSQLISYMNNIAYGCQAAFLLVAEYAVQKVGCVNSIAINIFLDAFKLVIYAYIDQSPPYFALALHVLNFTFVGFSWVAILKYAYRITPPQLTGTIVGIVMVFCAQICIFPIQRLPICSHVNLYQLSSVFYKSRWESSEFEARYLLNLSFFSGNSIAGLGGGQLLQHLNWTIPDIFKLTAVIGFVGGMIYLIIHYLFARKYEKILVAQLDKQYPDRWNTTNQETQNEVYHISGLETEVTSL